MKVIGQRARGQLVHCAHTWLAVPGTVNRGVGNGRLLPDVLHDVDLAAVGPMDRAIIVTQHPEGGPQPLPTRNLNPRLDAPVSPGPQTLRLEPRGRVLAVSKRLLPGFDDQVSVCDARVLRVGRVELEFVASPSG